jgi:hypothetical protein
MRTDDHHQQNTLGADWDHMNPASPLTAVSLLKWPAWAWTYMLCHRTADGTICANPGYAGLHSMAATRVDPARTQKISPKVVSDSPKGGFFPVVRG